MSLRRRPCLHDHFVPALTFLETRIGPRSSNQYSWIGLRCGRGRFEVDKLTWGAYGKTLGTQAYPAIFLNAVVIYLFPGTFDDQTTNLNQVETLF